MDEAITEMDPLIAEVELKAIKFDLMSSKDMKKYSSASIAKASNVTSAKLGLPNGAKKCETCGLHSKCDGHFSVIKLPTIVFNPYTVEEAVQLLNQICPSCHTPKKNRYSKRSDGATSQATCKYCSGSRINLNFNRTLPLWNRISVTAEVVGRVTDKLPQDYWDFLPHRHPSQSNITKILISPSQFRHILKQLDDPDLISRFVSRRELIYLSCLLVTPNFHRVAELPYEFSDGTRFVYRTVDACRKIYDLRQPPQFSVHANLLVTSLVMECLKSSKESSRDTYGMKWLKDSILSKRSNNSFRSTMVGDLKIRLHEIGIPMDLASKLHVSEYVNSYNFDNINSKCNLHLLAKEELLIKRNGKQILVKEANQLVIGDIVHKLLQDSDCILINRPPSVHQHSLIALSAKLLPVQSVLSINPLCCAPFMGDFDGDFLHGYVTQFIQSSAELGELVSLRRQLLNVQDGRSLVSLTHDSLAAAYLLTSSEVLLEKTEFQQFQMLCHPLSLTAAPSVFKSVCSHGPLWTGKQLFSMLLPSDMNFSTDPKVHIIDGENGLSGLSSVMFKEYGDTALKFLSSAQDILLNIYLYSDHNSRKKLADEVNLALDDAKEAFHIEQLLLSPNSILNLKCYDDCADLSNAYEQSEFMQNNLSIIKSSIMAFKSVFNDLLKMVHQHTSKDNSMMVMINSGSKGSMWKFVQQTACVGLQLPGSKFPFRIPPELSCASCNRHKSLNAGSTAECLGGQNLYAVIRNSFAGGLNPLECLLHSISGRENFFSANADVPGALTRKLISSSGQQIVRFTYDTAEPGAPVGSWAPCSISEAAYGALDHPVNSLEDSPLMNLQDVLKCQKGISSRDHFVLLFLSKNVKKYRYGLEYASLEVKDHLEPVKFSDLVDTVMILSEFMTRKRLGLALVVEELTEQYNATRNKPNNVMPDVYISKGKCSAGNACVSKQTCCITVVVTQDESNSMSQLDSIKKRVIPSLLAIPVKGFWEFKDVEIQCHEDGEPVVKVVMSEHCNKSGIFWATLQKSCVAIMALIDWEWSRPGSVYDIFCSYGTDSAWKYFVESLRSKTDDIGRNIHRKHLLVMADCLSVSGQLHGLSSQGLKQQRTRLAISSPFSEACFSRPAHSFINAAKQSSVDYLCGTVDAMAFYWDVGSFKDYEHALIPNENIYDFLHGPEVREVSVGAVLNGSTISVEQNSLGATVDKSHVIEALRFHPRGREKIGAGIRNIKIGHHPSHPGTRCFILVRNDGTTEDVSYKKCVQGAADLSRLSLDAMSRGYFRTEQVGHTSLQRPICFRP
ncbi:hypothetical protein VPH35_000504 [Triticum aestivum]